MKLFRPAWQKDNREKALRFVGKCDDQAILADVARQAPDTDVRIEALKKLNSQRVILDIALHSDRGPWIWETAVGRLTDQKVLLQAAKQGPGKVKLAAVKKLTDQQLLAELVCSAREDEVALAAAEKLEGQKTMEETAKAVNNTKVRKRLLERMPDREAAVDLAMEFGGDYRRWAISRMEDQDRLYRIAWEENDRFRGSRLRTDARSRITDERLRRKLALTDEEAPLAERLAAAEEFRPDDEEMRHIISLSEDEVFLTALLRYIPDEEKRAEIGVSHSRKHDNFLYHLVQTIETPEGIRILLASEGTAEKAKVRARQLGMPEEEIGALLPPKQKKIWQLEQDEAAFLKKIQDDGDVARAYRAKDVGALGRIASARAVEAMILLLRREGQDPCGGASDIGQYVRLKLRDLWVRRGCESLKPAIREARKYPITGHSDSGHGSCHDDRGPESFVFQ